MMRYAYLSHQAAVGHRLPSQTSSLSVHHSTTPNSYLSSAFYLPIDELPSTGDKVSKDAVPFLWPLCHFRAGRPCRNGPPDRKHREPQR